MNGSSAPSQPSITVRLSADEKKWFAVLARSRGVSESALALSAIRSIADSGSLDAYATGPRTPATDRITIRLRPGDGAAIARRASERGMKSSAYLAALVRAHLAMNSDMDSPCSYGIVCARLKVLSVQSQSKGSRNEDYTSGIGYR